MERMAHSNTYSHQPYMKRNNIMSKDKKCPECNSTNIIVNNVTAFVCLSCGFQGNTRAISEMKPRIIQRRESKPKLFIKKNDGSQFLQSTNPSFCPKCDKQMKKEGNLYKCKCGYWVFAGIME